MASCRTASGSLASHAFALSKKQHSFQIEYLHRALPRDVLIFENFNLPAFLLASFNAVWQSMGKLTVALAARLPMQAMQCTIPSISGKTRQVQDPASRVQASTVF